MGLDVLATVQGPLFPLTSPPTLHFPPKKPPWGLGLLVRPAWEDGVKGKACVDPDTGSGLLWQGILGFWGLETRLCQVPLCFMVYSLLGRGIWLKECQNRAINLGAQGRDAHT